jgi:TRAP transporter TAXI family solute receptor
MRTTATTVFGAGVLLSAIAAAAGAQELKLPSTVTLTAYDTGSSGFNIAVAVGKTLKDKYGTDMRVLPAGTDVARLAPLKAGRAHASAMGIGAYFAQEGVFEFAAEGWGPQPTRLVLSVIDCNGLTLGVAKDTGVKQVKDLKGKRIGIVVGSPALNQGALAVLAFGGLTKKDVKFVEFSSYGAMWKGMVNNQVDAGFGSTIAGQAKEVEASPRGLMFPPAPFADKAGWTRLQKLGPYFSQHKVTCGPGASEQAPLEMPAYPYPIFMAYAQQPADLIYSLAKAMIANYAAYKDAAPGAAGLELKRQDLSWVVPYHEGAVKAFREVGAWTKEHDAHNQALIKRQDTLIAAWQAFLKTSPPSDAEQFRSAWMSARAAALKKAGLQLIFE